jgi:hypothetical protein
VLNEAFSPVVSHSWIPSSALQFCHFREQNSFSEKNADLLGDVPVMSSTVLGLDLLLHASCIDLRRVSELVLSDVGATLQVLRLIGSEYECAGERPSRMDDCIASLDVGCWFSAVSAHTFGCDQEHAATSALWNHSRLIAQYSQQVARSLDGVSPEDAYLVGLLHEIGTLPSVLGWKDANSETTDNKKLMMDGSLPLFVLAALRSLKESWPSSTWRFILSTAHDLAETNARFDPEVLQGFLSPSMRSRWMRSLNLFDYSGAQAQ